MSPHTTKEQIARLEELLQRVKMRASAPRPAGVAVARAAHSPPAPPVAYSPPPAPVAPAYSPPPAPVAPSSPPSPPTIPPATPAADAANTSPPPTAQNWSEPPADDATEIGYANDDVDVDVEVSSEVVEVDIDVDEGGAVMPAESGAQPVAEFSSPPPELIEEPVRTEPSHRPPPVDETPIAQPANEVVEPAPSSSPRPIEPPTYEEESAPRHTPPPESGKQVAVAPSAPPRPRSEPPALASAPPPSLEGHTLVGGWREPGIPAATGSAPGVRVPPPAPSGSVPDVSQTRLSPEVTRAELPAVGKVASFEGQVAPFKPASFGELLDASLGL